MSVENIVDYGAVKNPNDPDLSTASTNRSAIRDAADAAGEDGTVYVPEGTYYYGDNDYEQLLFGEREPAGVSFTGDGPTKSKLALTGNLSEPDQYWMFIYYRGHDHGTVSFDNLEIDGNAANLGDVWDRGKSGRGIHLDGTGSLELSNVHIHDTYAQAVQNSAGGEFHFDRCTFENNSVQLHLDSDGDKGSHHIAGGGPMDASKTATVKNSVFDRVARSTMNMDSNGAEGTVRFENCWAGSHGAGFCKFSAPGTLELRNCYVNVKSSWTTDVLGGAGGPDGWYFAYRLNGDPNAVGTMDVQDSEIEDMGLPFLRAMDVAGGSDPLHIEWIGGNVAIKNTNSGSDAAGAGSSAVETAGGSFENVDVGEVSFSNTNGKTVFDVSDGSGRVGTLDRDTTGGLGDTDGITIGTDNPDSGPLSPSVPTQAEVGIDTDGREPDSAPSVAWQAPADGATATGTAGVQISASDAEDADDALTVEYRVDGGAWTTAAYDAGTGYYEDTWDTTTLADGDYGLDARATDGAGTVSTASIAVMVDNESTIGDDWTPRWGSSESDWSVVPGSEFEGGYALAFEHAGEDRLRYATSLDAIGRASDVETLDRFRVRNIRDDQPGAAHARVYVRAGTTSAGQDGYLLDVDHTDGADQPTAFRVGKYTDGWFSVLKRFGTPEEDRFYYRRFRAEGTDLKAKVWPATESEPAEWDVTLSDGDHSSGWVGVGSFDPQLVETDVFSVATGGGSAELLRSDDPPSVDWVAPGDGAVVSGEVGVRVAASDAEDDDDALTVEYRVDGGAWTTAAYDAGTGYYEDTWDTTTLADGDHVVEAAAVDAAGNASTATITVASDNARAPTVDDLSAAEVETDDSDAEFDAGWRVSDPDGDLESVELSLIGQSDDATVASTSSGVAGETAAGTTRLVAPGADGSGAGYRVAATVTDGDGTTATDTVSVSETEGETGTPPTIDRVDVSEAGRPDDDAEITVVWDVSDPDADLASVDITVEDSNGATDGVRWTLSGASASDVDAFDVGGGDGGTFDVSLTVTDVAGHSVTETRTVTA